MNENTKIIETIIKKLRLHNFLIGVSLGILISTVAIMIMLVLNIIYLLPLISLSACGICLYVYYKSIQLGKMIDKL